MDVDSIFKPAGHDVRLLIVHSTKDNLGEHIADELDKKLKKEIQVLPDESVANFKELVDLMQRGLSFNVLLFIAHGDKSTNATRLYDDKDNDNRKLNTNAGELAAALDGHVDDKLCLFGVCYSGTDDLAAAICHSAGALACIAPKPDCDITGLEIVTGYGCLLNRMQALSYMDVGIEQLHSDLVPLIPPDLIGRLSIEPRPPDEFLDV